MRVRAALNSVVNPASGRSIVADGAVQGLDVKDGVVRFMLEAKPGWEKEGEALLEAAKQAAMQVDGVSRVSCVATAHNKAPAKPAASTPPPAGGHANPFGINKKPAIETAAESMSGVKSLVAIASGKGGVGKSTVAVNLAVALAKAGYKTGLMDADIYGPSLPTLLGASGKAEIRDGKIIPREAFGVKAMSIGWLVDETQALAWRGPMVMGAIRQLMSDVDWGALDILLIDTPPGTGDAHLSLIQSKRLSGAVIVSTPQEMALADVRRGAALFRKTDTPIIGVIENMAWLEGPAGGKHYLFGEGGAEKAARELNAPFLGAIPLYPDLRKASDEGRPLAATDHPASGSFELIAKKIAAAIPP